MGPFRLPMLGQHNVQNALAAIAVGVEMDIDDDTIRSALAGFKGVKRRFTQTGEAGGITVIDDYGHHPVEIAAVLKAARQAGARDVIAVVQPHRYSRLHIAVRGVLHLHERCRHGDRRRCLCRRRGADRRASTATRWSRACARAAIAAWCRCPARSIWPRWCMPSPAGRLRGLPRRRQHHQLGACPARTSWPRCRPGGRGAPVRRA